MLNSTYPKTCRNFACSFLQIDLSSLIFIWPRFLLNLSSGRGVHAVFYYLHIPTPHHRSWCRTLKSESQKISMIFWITQTTEILFGFVYFIALTCKQNPGIMEKLNPGLFKEQIFSIDILHLRGSQLKQT